MITLTFTVEVEVDEEEWRHTYDTRGLTVVQDAAQYLPQRLGDGLAVQRQTGVVRHVTITQTSVREGCSVPGCVWTKDHNNPQHLDARGNLFTP